MFEELMANFNVLRTLKSNVWLKTSQLEELQERHFFTLLHHAYQNVAYYRDLFDSIKLNPDDIKHCKDISKIPITTKAHIQKAQTEMLAKNIPIWVKHKTSGSTGISLVLSSSMKDAIYSRGMYERARVQNGFRILKDTLAYIGSPFVIPQTKKWYENFGIRRKQGINVFDPLEKQIHKLKIVSPDALWGYPSAIKLLAKTIDQNNIQGISPRLIFTSSELLDQETRTLINSVFNVNLVDVYAAWEAGCMAWECSEHAGYHINMDQVLMEFIDENGDSVKRGERGKVVITNLHSYAMPIIRYELGDYAVPTYETCPCGRGGYLLKAVEGRCDDFLTFGDNRLFAPPLFWSIMKSISGISEFQVIQEEINAISVFVTKLQDLNNGALSAEVEAKLRLLLGNTVSINTRIVERIEREQSGKLRSVISRV